MRRGKSDWLLIAVEGLLGLFVGDAVVLLAPWSPETMSSLEPVDFHCTYSDPRPPSEDARLDVEILGLWRYSRTAADHHDFDAEMDFLHWMNMIPVVVCIGLGFALGVQVGAMTGRWARRRRSVGVSAV
jgi:hypothetical protein